MFMDRATRQEWIAALDGEQLGTLIPVTNPMSMAISPDGKRVAIPAGVVQVIDLATGHAEPWPDSLPAGCEMVQSIDWGVADDELFYTARCKTEWRAFSIRRGSKPVEVYNPTGAGWIAGIHVGPDDLPVIAVRQVASSTVIVDL